VRRNNASDLNVAHFDRPAGALPRSGNAGRSDRGRLVERLDAFVKVLGEQSGECLL
jgi:hypothetical protein